MKRLKAIDIFRGFNMVLMVWVHLRDWWIINGTNSTLNIITRSFIDRSSAGMFLFISGVSTFISYHNRLKKISDTYTFQMLKKEYMFRAMIIVIIALVYNIFVAIIVMDPLIVWTWFMLLSISFSLFMTWPLLKTSKSFRIGVAISVFIVNEFVYWFLTQHKNEINFYGILYYILYNTVDLEPILVAFPFFLIGTVVGDLILDIFNIEHQKERRLAFKNKLLIPSFITGLCLILFTLVYILPEFFQGVGFYWIYFSMGVCLIFLLILLLLEEFGVFNTEKSYKFLFFYSYYSLTVYLTHNALYFLFYNQLSEVFFWLFAISTIILFEILLKIIYKKYGPTFSVKIKIGKLAVGLSKKF
jgi:uncharacterized membrane protein